MRQRAPLRSLSKQALSSRTDRRGDQASPSRRRLVYWLTGALIGAVFSWYLTREAVSVGSPLLSQVIAGPDSRALRMKLAREPLNSEALRDLALAVGIETPEGLRLLRLASAVSRQDLKTQLYLLEYTAQTGDLDASLRHYDAVLSAHPATSSLLLGILARGLVDPGLSNRLVPYASRSWFVPLIRETAGTQGNPLVALELARKSRVMETAGNRDILAPVLLNSLIASGSLAEANALADTLELRAWRDIGFNRTTLDRRLGDLAWRLETTGDPAAQWQPPNTLWIMAEPLRRGIVARRTTLFSPGKYMLNFKVERSDHPLIALEWQVVCPDQKGPTKLVHRDVPTLGPQRLVVIVPADCQRQIWSLRASAGDEPSGGMVQLYDLTLAKQ